ncbi:hypothetical protein LCGC14_2479940 [marine sediment metagenome]|uniref:Uncharacterized protein n=1 Tax=marine sediment metagenome TaxID=412755 RepID=A0A0F9E1J0_9ZZZZ
MLEIRYNKQTKELTGWWGSRFGNHDIKLKNRPNEAIVALDISIPDKSPDAWLYDKATKTLIPNLNYVEPKPSRNLVAEVDALKEQVKELTK